MKRTWPVWRSGQTMARLGTFGLYRCADGYVAITAGGPQANALCVAAGKPAPGYSAACRADLRTAGVI